MDIGNGECVCIYVCALISAFSLSLCVYVCVSANNVYPSSLVLVHRAVRVTCFISSSLFSHKNSSIEIVLCLFVEILTVCTHTHTHTHNVYMCCVYYVNWLYVCDLNVVCTVISP